MVEGLTSIIIPTYNHASYVLDAINSALAQTAPVEVLVIDDGSTDGTAEVLAPLHALLHSGADARLRLFRIDHSGPSATRNAGIQLSNGEFVMFLDADDVIAPEKVAVELVQFADGIGWVLCDVLIDEAEARIGRRPRRSEFASARYDYAGKRLAGWIGPLLERGNFIPVMSPLVRRSVLGDAIRFREERPEDWYFWREVAAAARCRYIPQVLATYRKRRGGRNGKPGTPADEKVVLFSPHNDDEALFASFTILRYQPIVVVCFGSVRDYGEPSIRTAESRAACAELGAARVDQWAAAGDLERRMRQLDTTEHPVRAFAPDPWASHPEHVAVARAAAAVFKDRLTTYHTYDAGGKVRSGHSVPFEPAWLQKKMLALSCYSSQIAHPRAHEFFTYDLREYYGKESTI